MKKDLASAVIVEDGKVLLLKKIKHGWYEFAGGKVEYNETKEDACIREAKEEIDCVVKIVKPYGEDDFVIEGVHYHNYRFLCKIVSGVPRLAETHKFSDLIFMDISKFEDYTLASDVIDFCKEYLDGELD